jgi:hypothetical protein
VPNTTLNHSQPNFQNHNYHHAEQPKLPDNFERDTWAKLQDAVDAVHCKRAVACSLEELYRVRSMVFLLCSRVGGVVSAGACVLIVCCLTGDTYAWESAQQQLPSSPPTPPLTPFTQPQTNQ